MDVVSEDMERLQELKVNSPKYQPLNMPDIVFIDDVVPPPAPPFDFGMKPWMVDGPGAYPPNPDVAGYIKKGGNPMAGYKSDKYCRNCGAKLTLGMNFCSECGNKLQ